MYSFFDPAKSLIILSPLLKDTSDEMDIIDLTKKHMSVLHYL